MKVICSRLTPENCHPLHILADFIRCKSCDGKVVLTNKHYTCSNAKRKFCDNKLLIPQKQVRALVTADLYEKFLSTRSKCSFQLAKSYYVAEASIQTFTLLDLN